MGFICHFDKHVVITLYLAVHFEIKGILRLLHVQVSVLKGQGNETTTEVNKPTIRVNGKKINTRFPSKLNICPNIHLIKGRIRYKRRHISQTTITCLKKNNIHQDPTIICIYLKSLSYKCP